MSINLKFHDYHLPDFKNNWRQFLMLGVALILLGCVAIGMSLFATMLSIVLFGTIILVSGGVMLLDSLTFWRGKGHGFYAHVILAALYLIVGVLVIMHPLMASIPLTLLLGLFFIIAGIGRIIFFSLFQSPRWGWGWFNGVVTLILGTLIITSWPASSLFVIGLFVGLDLVCCGWAYTMAALSAKTA